MTTPWRLYYDSNCGFCSASARRAVRWAKRTRQPLTVLPLDGPEAKEKGFGDTLALEADRVYLGGDAWLRLFSVGPWYMRLFALLRLTSPTRRLVAGLYAVAAASRSCDVSGGRLDAESADEQRDDVEGARDDCVRVPRA